MNASTVRLRPRAKARVEIIPLIDVVFFLLATFVLFTLSLNRTQSIPLPLPYSQNDPQPSPATEPVRLHVSDNDQLHWNGEPIFLRELPSRIAFQKSIEPGLRVMVSGGGKATIGTSVQVFDMLRLSGVAHYSVDTRKPPSRGDVPRPAPLLSFVSIRVHSRFAVVR